MNTIATYTGIWRFPLKDSFEDCMGILEITDNGIMRLEIDHSDTLGVNLQRIDSYPQILGKLNQDTPVTLGDVNLRSTHNFTRSTFLVEKAILGALVDSFDEPAFNACIATYQYLRDWTKPNNIVLSHEGVNPVIKLDFETKNETSHISIEPDVDAYLWDEVGYNHEMYDYKLYQKSSFNLESKKGISANKCFEIVNKFSLFLSIALYRRQSPSHIIFRCAEQPNYNIYFYFRHKTALEPGYSSLISYKDHKESIPSILEKWFSSYGDIAPIARYLINGISREDISEAPDYLCIAQGLDGYYRRFLRPDCKSSAPFNNVIREIREHFIGVNVISKCRFWSDSFQAARNYYTHLLNERTAEKYRLILEQTNLRLLNDKAIILLTCCVLDFFGFTNDEINKCILHSQFAYGKINYIEHLQSKDDLKTEESYGLIYDYLDTFTEKVDNDYYRNYTLPDSRKIVLKHEDQKHNDTSNLSINGKSIDTYGKEELIDIINSLYSGSHNAKS